MAFKSYYDWSEHWYVCEQDNKMETRRKRSSLFDVNTQLKLPAAGSSVCSFACEPSTHGLDEIRQHRKVNYENTYRLEPQKAFCPDLVKKIIQDILDANLEDRQYDHVECNTLTKSLTDELKCKIKDLNFQRYKLVCSVMIGQNKDQGIRISSRFLWDPKRDNYASASFVNTSLFATGTVYAIYFE